MKLQTIKSCIAITLISAFSMAAQAGNSATDQQAAVSGTDSASSSVIIYRPKQSASVKTINYRLFVDGKSLGRLKTSSHYSLDLAPCTHKISVHDKAKSGYILNVAAGETLVIKGLVNRKLAVDFTEMAASAAVAEAPFVAKDIQAAEGKTRNQLGSL